MTSTIDSTIDFVKEQIGNVLGREGHGEGTESPSAFTILMAQHREVDALFLEIEQAGDRAFKEKEELAKRLIEKLSLHTMVEETVFYPKVKEIDNQLVLEAYEEHDAVKSLLNRIAKTSPQDEAFQARIKVLREFVHHHVREEETNLFPKIKAALSEEQLGELGELVDEAATNPPVARKMPVRTAAATRRASAGRKAAKGRAAPKKASVTKKTSAKKATKSSSARGSATRAKKGKSAAKKRRA